MLHLDTKPLIPTDSMLKNPYSGQVSVIIPAFNCAGTIGACIESMQKQTYKNLQIIVVDDASTDNTGQVVANFDVEYILLPENKGASVAKNTGAMAAKGAVITFAEADGYYDEDYIEKILRPLHIPGVVASINLGRKVWTRRNTPLVRHQNDLFEAAVRLVEKGKRGTGAWAFAVAPFWEIGGYDPECRVGEDMDLVRRLVRTLGRTAVGGRSTLHHKDPDTLRKYWRRAYWGGFFSGKYQAKWKSSENILNKLLYLAKYFALAAAPLYFLASILIHWAFALPFAGVAAYLLLEDPTTTLAWTFSAKRYDLLTFIATPFFLYVRRLAIGWGRIKSFLLK